MNCQEVRKLLVAYLDSEVTPSERVLIGAHLAECTSCQEEVAALSALQSRVSRSLQVQAAQTAPSPEAWSHLQARLAGEVRPSPAWLPARLPRLAPGVGRISQIFVGGVTMKKGFALATLVVLVIGLAAVAFIPSVQAQVSERVAKWFGIRLFGGGINLEISGPAEFTPLQPTYLPDTVLSGHVSTAGSVTTGAEDKVGLLIGNPDDQWLCITQGPAPTDRALPEGKRVQVNGQEAVLLASQSGVVMGPPRPLEENSGEELVLPPGCLEAMTAESESGKEPAPLPPECQKAIEEAGDFSVVNGVAYKSKKVRPSEMNYENATVLIWYAGNTRIEVLSNLPEEEMLKIAESMVPAEAVEGEPPLQPHLELPSNSEEKVMETEGGPIIIQEGL